VTKLIDILMELQNELDPNRRGQGVIEIKLEPRVHRKLMYKILRHPVNPHAIYDTERPESLQVAGIKITEVAR